MIKIEPTKIQQTKINFLLAGGATICGASVNMVLGNRIANIDEFGRCVWSDIDKNGNN